MLNEVWEPKSGSGSLEGDVRKPRVAKVALILFYLITFWPPLDYLVIEG